MSAPFPPQWFWGVRNLVFLAVYSAGLFALVAPQGVTRLLLAMNRSRPPGWSGARWLVSSRARAIFRVYGAILVIGGLVFFFDLGGPR